MIAGRWSGNGAPVLLMLERGRGGGGGGVHGGRGRHGAVGGADGHTAHPGMLGDILERDRGLEGHGSEGRRVDRRGSREFTGLLSDILKRNFI